LVDNIEREVGCKIDHDEVKVKVKFTGHEDPEVK
jgi:hypothetical protein